MSKCKTCKWWLPEQDSGLENFRACVSPDMAFHEPEGTLSGEEKALLWDPTGCFDFEFLTRSDFGCVLYEENMTGLIDMCLEDFEESSEEMRSKNVDLKEENRKLREENEYLHKLVFEKGGKRT